MCTTVVSESLVDCPAEIEFPGSTSSTGNYLTKISPLFPSPPVAHVLPYSFFSPLFIFSSPSLLSPPFSPLHSFHSCPAPPLQLSILLALLNIYQGLSLIFWFLANVYHLKSTEREPVGADRRGHQPQEQGAHQEWAADLEGQIRIAKQRELFQEAFAQYNPNHTRYSPFANFLSQMMKRE